MPVISQSFWLMWIGFGIQFRLHGLMNHILFFVFCSFFCFLFCFVLFCFFGGGGGGGGVVSYAINFQGIQFCLGNFAENEKKEKHFTIGLYWDIYWPVFFRHVENKTLLNCVLFYKTKFEWLWPSIKVTVVWGSRILCTHFLTNFVIILDEI